MLIRIVALMLKDDGKEKLKLITNLKELLSSKDFKVSFAVSQYISRVSLII
jgi:hypothetical protein